MPQKKQVLFISGTPGVGKSTLCKELEKFNFAHLDVGKLVKDKKLYSRYDRKTDSFVVLVKKMRNTVKKIIRTTQTNIAVDWIHSYELANLVRGGTKRVIVLRCEPLILYKRILKKYGIEKTKENVLSEFLNQISQEAHEMFERDVIEIDTTNRSPKKIAQGIIKDKFKPGKKIDWMKKYLNDKQRLNMLFKVVEG
ncbi:adenylate kinase family protein [archaeon]|jgi:adenylate kinase|nr:adenylate kinase family protein [archaeon]